MTGYITEITSVIDDCSPREVALSNGLAEEVAVGFWIIRVSITASALRVTCQVQETSSRDSLDSSCVCSSV